MIINIIIAFLAISTFTILLVALLTQHLHGKSKSNKLRQWWSNHIVDLDDRYND